MKKIQSLLIGSLILNAALFAIVGVGSSKKTETAPRSAEVSAASAPKPQAKNVEIPDMVAPLAKSQPSLPAHTSPFSSAEASPHTASSPVPTYAARNASPVSASSSPKISDPSSSASSGYAAPLPSTGASAPIQSSPVTISIPAGPGNSITYRGQQAAITSARTATDSEPASLDASVTPAAGPASNSSTAQTGNSPEAASNSSMPFDDQLFRTKWGWEAYDQARKAASLAASAAATTGN